MRDWNADGRAENDTRLSACERWLFTHSAPMCLLNIVRKMASGSTSVAAIFLISAHNLLINK